MQNQVIRHTHSIAMEVRNIEESFVELLKHINRESSHEMARLPQSHHHDVFELAFQDKHHNPSF